jgi:hypothetical protein
MDTGLTITVSGKAFPVKLETHPKDWVKAKFTLHLGEGNDVDAASFAELEAKVKDLRLVRFELPFTMPNGRGGMVTGFHASNGNMLIRWDSGKTSQEYGSGLADAMPRLSEDDLAELKQLVQARSDAYSALAEWVKAHRFPEGIGEAADEARRLAGGVDA